jgi:hypothetical protein
MIEKIKHLLKQKNAVLVAHYYVSELTLLVITLLNPYFFKPKEYEFATGLRSRFGLLTL